MRGMVPQRRTSMFRRGESKIIAPNVSYQKKVLTKQPVISCV